MTLLYSQTEFDFFKLATHILLGFSDILWDSSLSFCNIFSFHGKISDFGMDFTMNSLK